MVKYPSSWCPSEPWLKLSSLASVPALSESQIYREKLPMGMSTFTTQPLTLLPAFPGSVSGGQPLSPLGAAVLPERLPELGICFTAFLCPLMALKAQPGFGREM